MAFRIIGNVLALYFAGYALLNIAFLVFFLASFIKKKGPRGQRSRVPGVQGSRGPGLEPSNPRTLSRTLEPFLQPSAPFFCLPGITILVPAYNEAETIGESLKALLGLDYPEYRLVVVNDGSSDRTLDVLKNEFGLEPTEVKYEDVFGTAPVRGLWRSREHANLLVVDKPNSGKADSLNVGLELASERLVVTIDADTILDPMSLRRLAHKFTNERVAAAGGLLTVANGARIEHGKLVSAELPRRALVMYQLVEYLISYTVGRVGLSRLNSLLVLSGAFSMFDRELLMKAGGFLTRTNNHPYLRRTIGDKPTTTVCEDMEVIIRLHRFIKEKRLNRKIVFDPSPIAWTEVPQRLHDLARQRNRWHRGLLESLVIHRRMVFEPRYGWTGLFAMPYYLVFEALSPLVKLLGIGFVLGLAIVGLVDLFWLLLLAAAALMASALITALVTVSVENRFAHMSRVNIEAMRYHDFRAWLRLLAYSMLSSFVYDPLRFGFQLWGIWDWVRGSKDWYKFRRTSYGREDV